MMSSSTTPTGDHGVSPRTTPSNNPETSTDSMSTPRTQIDDSESEFILKVCDLLQKIINKYCATLREAMEIFEVYNAIHYSNYVWLKARLGEHKAIWMDLSSQSQLSIEFLHKSACSLNFDADVRRLSSPRNATRAYREKMQRLRDRMKHTQTETILLRGQLDETFARLEEGYNGDCGHIFPDLPLVTNAPSESVFDISEDQNIMLSASSPHNSPSNLEDSPGLTPTNNDHTPESDDQASESSEYEDGWDIASRRGYRDEKDLEKNGFRPVWTGWGGYPGEIPDDIKEWLNDNGERKHAQYIGPIRSLFWIGGFDEVVEAIDDPAFVIEDEIRLIPDGAGLGFLIDDYFENNLMPRNIYLRSMGYSYYPPRYLPILAARVNRIPTGITNTPTSSNINSIFPLSRPQCLPESVRCVKLKWEKHPDKFLSKVRESADGLFEKKNLWFRGFSSAALMCTLTFFVPVITSNGVDNEFGPGFYTANSLEYALDYSGRSGALMVFDDPDLRGLAVWEPKDEQWNQLVAIWTQSNLSGVSEKMPKEYKKADFVRGAISEKRSDTSKKSRFPEKGEYDQLVAVSYDGCKALSKSLAMIIYIEP